MNSSATAVGSYAATSIYAIGSNGLLYAWGNNVQGQLGDGTTTNRTTPVLVGSGALAGKVITKVSVSGSAGNNAGGWTSVAAIDSTGQLYTWGYNGNGQLGQGNTTQLSNPTAVSGFTNVSDVIVRGENDYSGSASSGTYNTFTVVLRTNGTVWSAGTNRRGELADGTTTQRTSFTQESTLKTNITKIFAGVAGQGGDNNGGGMAAIVDSSANVYFTGYNVNGQLGVNDSSHTTTVVVTTLSGDTSEDLRDVGLERRFLREARALGGSTICKLTAAVSTSRPHGSVGAEHDGKGVVGTTRCRT
jgi:alpha-tubulin suppressor-like RCC1 family protein